MSSFLFTQFLSLPIRWNSKAPDIGHVKFMLVADQRLRSRWVRPAMSKNVIAASLSDDDVSEEAKVTKKTRSKRGRKKATPEANDVRSESSTSGSFPDRESSDQETSNEGSEKPKRRPRRKAVSTSSSIEEGKTEKKTRRGRKSKNEVVKADDRVSEPEVSDTEGIVYVANDESDDDDVNLVLETGEDDDISSSYGWPPLVCCFGAAQHAFIPSGKPSNRLIDHEIHESLKDALWAPEKFCRAPGGSAGSVSIALAALGGRVAFMGKLGNDDYGQAMLYYLNFSQVQTRSVSIDNKRPTAISHMKIAKRGSLGATNVKPCAEDSLTKSEINIDVLKEAKMFYVNTSSLLDSNMRRTTQRATKISKKLGGTIFYDLNLPLPLWKSNEETKSFIQNVWNLADVIEVTKQEFEFLCGIESSEEFDTMNNKAHKFINYGPELVAPLWHENLKVLIVTNGTSKIHYYTKEHYGAVLGMEDAPITPFTQDMSATGDGVVAALMRMFSVQPHLITDKGYLEHAIKYAINCGVIDQWIVARQRGFPPKEGTEDDEEFIPDPNGIKSITERQFRTVIPVPS